MASKYQTLSEFILAPFHKKQDLTKETDYANKYRSFSSSNKIKIHAVCEIEDSVYMHLKVPSESQKNGKYEYDVVIRFFTDNAEVAVQSHVKNYYVQFFSNSPSFIYQYAYLYKKEGYLIEALYNKLDAEYADVAPEKTNADMKMSYDKSIYFACHYLSDNKMKALSKTSFTFKKKSKEAFFREISDFKSMKFDRELMAEENKLSKILDSKTPRSRRKQILSDVMKKKHSTNSTSKNGSSINIVTKKTGASAMVTKKVARKTTRRK